MTENELAKIAVDICYKIHTTLVRVYWKVFMKRLLHMNLNKKVFCIGFRADIIVENKLIVEIKSVEHLEKVHHNTTLTYLRLAGIKLAILVNFNVNLIKDGIHRKIMGELV